MFNTKKIYEYFTSTPDRSLIEVHKNEVILGHLIWDSEGHKYLFKTENAANEKDLEEMRRMIIDLNKSTKLPKWLNWK